jgi:hypothetical protein
LIPRDPTTIGEKMVRLEKRKKENENGGILLTFCSFTFPRMTEEEDPGHDRSRFFFFFVVGGCARGAVSHKTHSTYKRNRKER